MILLLCKVIGSLLVFGSCTAVGFAYSAGIRRKRETAQLMIRYWKAFLQYLTGSMETTCEIAELLGNSIEFLRFPFAQEMRREALMTPDFSQVLLMALTRAEIWHSLSEALEPICESVGRHSLEGQQRTLDEVLLSVIAERDYWEDKENKQGLLARRAGVLGGVALVVLLL